jgi:Protein of unknown function (DUF2281)
MKMITIPELEYLQLQQTISILQQQLSLFQDQDFVSKLNLAYQLFLIQKPKPIDDIIPQISIKRGSAKHLITYIADDFTDPLEDFKDYM